MKLVGLTEVYEQEEDSCGRVDASGQDLTIEIADAGGGPYAVIKTERWAMNEEDLPKLTKVIKAAIARATRRRYDHDGRDGPGTQIAQQALRSGA